MWIPSHIEIRDNERADQAARQASNSEGRDDGIPAPYRDLFFYIKSTVVQIWQDQWDQYSGHMRRIKQTVSKQIYPKELSRKEQVLLCRLRIGHTNLTHSHLLNRDPMPRCTTCDEVLTVEHILIYCSLYEHLR